MTYTQPVLNEQMLDLVINFIQLNPDKHDQESWVAVTYDESDGEICGTTCCVAGHALLLSGDWTLKEVMNHSGEIVDVDIVSADDGSTRPHYSREAAKVLGLTTGEADSLFDANNTRDDVLRIVEDIRDGVYR